MQNNFKITNFRIYFDIEPWPKVSKLKTRKKNTRFFRVLSDLVPGIKNEVCRYLQNIGKNLFLFSPEIHYKLLKMLFTSFIFEEIKKTQFFLLFAFFSNRDTRSLKL